MGWTSSAALARAAEDVQPTCQGTIRFSTWRGYAMLQDAIRLHRPDVWRPRRNAPAPAPEADERKFRLAHRAAIEAAVQALTAYYQRSFHAPADAAAGDARAAADKLVTDAFDFCD